MEMHYCLLVTEENTGFPLGPVVDFDDMEGLIKHVNALHVIRSSGIRFFSSFCLKSIFGVRWDEVFPDGQ